MTRPTDWTNLAQVVSYAETLGKGHVVFKDTHEPSYGVCKESEISTFGGWNGQWDKRGYWWHRSYQGIAGQAYKRYLIYVVANGR